MSIESRIREMIDASLKTLLTNAIARLPDAAAAKVVESIREERQRRAALNAPKAIGSRNDQPETVLAGCASHSGLTVGEVYKRADLHEKFGGQVQSGISTPVGSPFILLFTGDAGDQHGYNDGWEGHQFIYFGQGQKGDMVFQRGNLAIKNHLRDGKSLLLFQMLRDSAGHVRFSGAFVIASWEYRTAPDKDRAPRKAIVFRLERNNQTE